jgi:hypothetical protein
MIANYVIFQNDSGTAFIVLHQCIVRSVHSRLLHRPLARNRDFYIEGGVLAYKFVLRDDCIG